MPRTRRWIRRDLVQGDHWTELKSRPRLDPHGRRIDLMDRHGIERSDPVSLTRPRCSAHPRSNSSAPMKWRGGPTIFWRPKSPSARTASARFAALPMQDPDLRDPASSSAA